MKLINTYIKFQSSGIALTFWQLFATYLRGGLTQQWVEAILLANRLRMKAPPNLLEAHTLAGGNAHDVVAAAKPLHAANESIHWDHLFAIELKGGPVGRVVKKYLEKKQHHPDIALAEIWA